MGVICGDNSVVSSNGVVNSVTSGQMQLLGNCLNPKLITQNVSHPKQKDVLTIVIRINSLGQDQTHMFLIIVLFTLLDELHVSGYICDESRCIPNGHCKSHDTFEQTGAQQVVFSLISYRSHIRSDFTS